VGNFRENVIANLTVELQFVKLKKVVVTCFKVLVCGVMALPLLKYLTQATSSLPNTQGSLVGLVANEEVKEVLEFEYRSAR